MTFKFNENLLQYIWENQLFDKTELKTAKGEPLQVINPGLLNTNDGPDFQNAKIKIGKIYHHGSVEIHINSKDWNTHGHQNNKNYNGVILHVCYSVTHQSYRNDGTPVPSLSIGKRLNEVLLVKYQNMMKNQAFVPCDKFVKTLSSISRTNWIERVAVERIETRCKEFSVLLEKYDGDWNQTFYTVLLRSFGMPLNQLAFEEIAKKIPYKILKQNHESINRVEGLLFGVSGLLNEDLENSYYNLLKREWHFLKSKYQLDPISTPLRFGRTRPGNLPQIRIAQFCSLIHHSPEIFEYALTLPKINDLEKLFFFDLPSFWDTHYTFNKKSVIRKKVISKTFINHLIINAISPFTFYYEKTKVSEKTSVAISYLTQIKAEQNSKIKQWELVGIKCSNALTSQGLLHLYKNYCKNKKCLNCNWGKKFLSRNNEIN